MTNINDTIKTHTVIVDDGSGVLIQPMTSEYSYVLTARHNLRVDSEDESGIKSSIDKEVSTIKIFTSDDNVGQPSLTALDFYLHETLDIAIIRIAFKAELSIYPEQEVLQPGIEVWLHGYPGIKRKNNTEIKDQLDSYDLYTHDISPIKIKFRNTSDASIDSIKGFSGGGVFRINSERTAAYLVGIEYGMDDTKANHERLACVPIKQFNHIIEQNDLAPLKPIHLTNFNHIKDGIFHYDNCHDPNNLQSVTGLLTDNAAEKLLNCDITPNDILHLFEEQLRVHQQNSSELEKKGLWIAFLELISIIDTIAPQNTWNIDFIKLLFKFYRIIYIDSNKGWKCHLPTVYSTKVNGLKPNGRILLVTGGEKPDSPDALSVLHEKALPNIFNALQGEAIDNARHTFQNKIPIIHLPKLHDVCIVNKEWEYAGLNRVMHGQDIVKMLTEDYDKFLKIELN